MNGRQFIKKVSIDIGQVLVGYKKCIKKLGTLLSKWLGKVNLGMGSFNL